jgi:hypothetical protein
VPVVLWGQILQRYLDCHHRAEPHASAYLAKTASLVKNISTARTSLVKNIVQ